MCETVLGCVRTIVLGCVRTIVLGCMHYGVRLCALLCLVACADVSGCVGYVWLCELATSYVELRELLH